MATGGVFSTDGNLAPLPTSAGDCRRRGALPAVDDAHGLGASGGGTLGKAFGGFGAFVAGDAGLIETFVQRARTDIYTTALPVAVAAALADGLARA